MEPDNAGCDYDSIPADVVVAACQAINNMSLTEKEVLCDQIHADQPHVFLTTVALSQDGVSLARLDHALHVLMVVYLAFKNGAQGQLPVISRDMIAEAYKQLASMMNYLAGEKDRRMWNLTATSHPELWLLVYITGYLLENGFGVETDENATVIGMSKVILDVFVAAKKACSG